MGLTYRGRGRLGLLLLAVGGSVGCGTEMPEGRRVVTSKWDTILVVGSKSVDDTVLIYPWRVRAWGDQVVVMEDQVQQVRVFNTVGRHLWTFGRVGQGPGEFLRVSEIHIDRDGHLQIWDDTNRKIIWVAADGTAIDELYFREPWGLSTSPTPYGNRLLWSQISAERPAFITDKEELEVVDSVRIDWPVPEDLPQRADLMGHSAGFEGGWVTGLWQGPLFAVGSADGVEFYPYIKQFHFAYSPGTYRASDPLADSAYYGARDVSVVGEEIFFLSGGRPRRRAHDEEPTLFIDVYGLDGEYRRSYLLPSDTWAMSTEDGETFYVLTLVDEGYPHLLGLRPKPD